MNPFGYALCARMNRFADDEGCAAEGPSAAEYREMAMAAGAAANTKRGVILALASISAAIEQASLSISVAINEADR